jgi:spore coat protein U-like protein
MKLIRLIAAGASLAAGLPMAALAQPAPVNVTVSVTVQSACSALTSTQQANFGTHTPTASTPVTAEGIVTLTCNRGAAPLISVSTGANPTVGGVRRMLNGVANLISYDIRQPTLSGGEYTSCAIGNTLWDGATTLAASSAFAATGGPKQVKLCAYATLDADTLGSQAGLVYSDTVSVSISY